MDKTKWYVYFLYRQEEFREELDTEEQAFQFVKNMENGNVGGYAKSIWFGGIPEYVRNINEEAGLAYWQDLTTNDTFVEYR